MDIIEALFKDQLNYLEHSGIPQNVISQLERQKSEALEKTFSSYHSSKPTGICVPFIPVIPLTLVNAEVLMKAAGVYNALQKPADIKDLVEVPSAPYYIHQVMMPVIGRSAYGAKDLIQKNRPTYRVLTASESIALVTHSRILEGGYDIWAAGSSYQSDAWVPFIERGPRGPRLTWKYVLEHQLKQAVTPVCLK